MVNKRYFAYSSYLLAIADVFVIISLFFVFLFIHDPLWERSLHGLLTFAKVHYKSLILFILFWFFVSSYVKLYNGFRFERFLNVIRKAIVQVFFFTIVLFAISGGKKESLYTTEESIYFIVVLSIYLFLSRFFIFYGLKLYRKKGFNRKSVIFIGCNEKTEELVNLLVKQNDFGLNIKHVFFKGELVDSQITSEFEKLKTYLESFKIDYAYVSLGSGHDDELINKITEILEDNYVSIGYLPNYVMEIKQTLEVNYLDSFPILTYKKYPLDHSINQIIKRTFDIVFTLFAFVTLLWWLLPILAVAVYFSQGAPILFAQKRNGLNGKEFNCLKFRTMKPHKMNDLKPTERDDPRVTKLGRILRKTSLDELPQFFNVLKGEMSIVGPRPHMVSENESYSEIINRYSLRHYVKPGITGLAQVRGYRGAVDTEKDMELRIRTDIYYVRNWSFLLDLLIIYKTVKLMIVGDENAI